jgi:hypothetical protein
MSWFSIKKQTVNKFKTGDKPGVRNKKIWVDDISSNFFNPETIIYLVNYWSPNQWQKNGHR